MVFTIAVLTMNRKEDLFRLLGELSAIKREDVEILVVDNGSTDGTVEVLSSSFPRVQLIALGENRGVAGRNVALLRARGLYTITLDDDILGINDVALDHLQAMFEESLSTGAICFKVIDFSSGNICNWCHPYRPEEFADQRFETNEITEGAVVFRNTMLKETGLYPERFFISHEGTDLAARIIDHGYRIYYNPIVCVRHKYAPANREKWRRYYYDTRNNLWVAVRNYRLGFAMRYFIWHVLVMLVYSIRDGFFLHWAQAVKDGIMGLPTILKERRPISVETEGKIRRLAKNRPGVLYFLEKRLRSRQVRI